MSSKRRKLTRKSGTKRYKKCFILSCEGSKTEPSYFKRFKIQNSPITLTCLKPQHNSPKDVLKTMKEWLEKNPLKESDEAWLVVDKDQWTERQLSALSKWSKQVEKYALALSNPKFEFWLLLHFEDGCAVDALNIDARLKKYLPDYSKEIDPKKISHEMIKKAIKRAKKLDTPACSNGSQETGTTVYRLVENILAALKNPREDSFKAERETAKEQAALLS